MKQIDDEGQGMILYLQQEGRGIGLGNKIKAYHLQDGGADTVDANRLLGFDEDLRDYSCAACILQNIGVESVRLMTNNPAKINSLRERGIDVVSRVPLEIAPNPSNLDYLQTKKERMDHMLDL
jgi:3,4-dihydroxy 2-butanone 4-phosphate synthase/GTP cyclohydrolase II